MSIFQNDRHLMMQIMQKTCTVVTPLQGLPSCKNVGLIREVVLIQRLKFAAFISGNVDYSGLHREGGLNWEGSYNGETTVYIQ